MKIICTRGDSKASIQWRFLSLIPLFFTLLPVPAVAWGPVGHETVAYIAEDNLSIKANVAIGHIMGAYDVDIHLENEHFFELASIANWADEIRLERKDTAPWHFIDLPIRKDLTVKDEGEYCPDNNCVVNQLQIDEGIVGDQSQPRSKRYEALKFIVHFMGDLHQPLHCADDNDRGGNEKLIRFKTPGRPGHGAKIKLHALWDGLIELKTEEDPRTLASQLEGNITDQDRVDWVKGNENDWAFESYLIAKTKIYPGMKQGPQDYTDNTLPSSYYSRMRPILDQQLEKAGIRLADVLNQIFK